MASFRLRAAIMPVTKFKNGKNRKSQYFSDGYKGYRNAVGRKTEKVDLFLTGTLQRSLQTGIRHGTPALELRGELSIEKAEGNEKRFGKQIFSPTEEELDRLVTKWQQDVGTAFLSSFET